MRVREWARRGVAAPAVPARLCPSPLGVLPAAAPLGGLEHIRRPVARRQRIDLGDAQPLYPLLQSPAAPVRQAAAVSLSLVGDERAMPKLADALARESEAVTARTLETALARLEALPPPPLHVTLLGDFVLWRGEERVPENAWFRPTPSQHTDRSNRVRYSLK